MLRKIFWFIEDFGWNIRCRYNYWLHGPYGLAKVIEEMPFRYIISYLRKYGATIGDNCRIEKGVILHRPSSEKPFHNLIMGSHTFIGHKSLIDLTDKVIFENFAGIGGFCQIWTHQTNSLIPPCPENVGSVRLCEQSIIYSGSIISPGITIGRICYIGANSLVIKDIPDFSFAGGVPAKVIKRKGLS